MAVFHDVPDALVGNTAATLAFLILFLSIFLVVVLILPEKTEKLRSSLREGFQWYRSLVEKEVEEDLEPDTAGSTKPRKKLRKRQLQKLMLRSITYWVGDQAETDSPSEKEKGPDSAYDHADDVWQCPDALEEKAELKNLSLKEVFSLPDDVWQAPSPRLEIPLQQ